MRTIWMPALLSLMLAGSNTLVYLIGPKVGQLSGNGLPLAQLGLALVSASLAVPWARSLRRAATTLGARLEESPRLNFILAGLGAALLLLVWGLNAMEAAIEYAPGARRPPFGLPHLLGLLAATWQLWLAIALAAMAKGLLATKADPSRQGM